MNGTTSVFIEAEHFTTYGGWLLDQEFMDEMGSPYLLAHGMGCPVADAVTQITVPKAGHYRLWVRTFDWVAPWNAPGAPGKFQVLINEKPVTEIFGTKGASWCWQDGGTIELDAGTIRLALHDLTGFEGRCDALFLTTDLEFLPPNDAVKLSVFRRQLLSISENPEDVGSFDLVVAGGGMAGMCAAVAAARSGLSVALLNDRPVFGGNNSGEVRVGLGGNICLEPFAQIGRLMQEIEECQPPLPNGKADMALVEYDASRTAWLAAEPNITLFSSYRLTGMQKHNDLIIAVVAQHIASGQRIQLHGRFFADCTGDGVLGAHAQADFDMSMTGHMGPTHMWRPEDVGSPASFPRCPWAIDMTDKPFPGRGEHVAQWGNSGLHCLREQWFWECGFDDHPIADAERMRDQNYRAMYGAWDALKNVDGLYPNYRLTWVGHVGGKRESRRLLGDVIVNRGDLFQKRSYPDGCVPCTWHMDVHVPHKEYQKGFEGEEFISWCVIGSFPAPFWFPYRALYSRNIRNLFMAGRDVSVTHEALGTARLMRTGAMMGEVIGLAAAFCAEKNEEPRGVYASHWEDFSQRLQAGTPKSQTSQR